MQNKPTLDDAMLAILAMDSYARGDRFEILVHLVSCQRNLKIKMPAKPGTVCAYRLPNIQTTANCPRFGGIQIKVSV